MQEENEDREAAEEGGWFEQSKEQVCALINTKKM